VLRSPPLLSPFELIFAAGGSQDQQAHDGERCAGDGEGGVKNPW
jgi:hypothetical protein